MNLYPLKFNPILQERIWGGALLKNSLKKPHAFKGAGESWELSGVEGNISVVANGPLKGKSLQELMNLHGAALLGDQVYERFGNEFPILIKFLDAAQDLSIQVHPNDALAQERHACKGKNEMWYVMETAPEASLIMGFKEGVDQSQYEHSLSNNSIESLLERHAVAPSDCFFIEAGTIHAIGAGVLLAEIQQTSDVTYRVYDFDRKDKQGNKRPLHTEEALAALHYKPAKEAKKTYKKEINKSNALVASPYFNTQYVPVQGTYTKDMGQGNSFVILICVSGSATIFNDFGSETITYGETVLLAASAGDIAVKAPKGAVFLEVSLA